MYMNLFIYEYASSDTESSIIISLSKIALKLLFLFLLKAQLFTDYTVKLSRII